VLAWTERPDPVPGLGQALVRVHRVGLNLADVYRRNGTYHLAGNAPWILGYEGAGEIVSAPAGSGFSAGQRVAFADCPFANAELVAADLDRLIALPDSVSYELAAAVLLQGLTAQYLIRDSYRVRAGDRAVVHAAAGGVGLLLVKMIVHAGATAIGVVSSQAKRAAALAAGCGHALDVRDWPSAAKALAPHGFDVVYDSVGTTLADSLDVARTGGTVVFYGMAGGDPAPVDPRRLMDRSLRLVGGDLWNVLTSAHERRTRAADLFAALDAGLNVQIAARFALRDGAEAHRYLESRAAIGKVVLEV